MNNEQQQQAQAREFNRQFRLLEREIDRVQKQGVKVRDVSLIMLAIIFLLSVLITSPHII